MDRSDGEISEQENMNNEEDDHDMDEQSGGFHFSMEDLKLSVEINKSTIFFNNEEFGLDKKGVISLSNQNPTIMQLSFDPQCINFEEKRKIGQGTAGIVYAAPYEKNQFSKLVAVKAIQAFEKKSRDQFINQLKANMSNQGQTQYIVRFYGCYYKDYQIIQIFQYMNLGSLNDLIKKVIKKKQLLNEFILAELCLRMLKALQYIHNRNQIHRDIKPQNILINSMGELKISDFGISKQLSEAIHTTSTYCGTKAYMSPELTADQNHSFKTDIWSFGLVLYELATSSENPYVQKSKKMSEIVFANKLKSEKPPTIPQFANRSPQLCHFFNCCLQKNPNDRPDQNELLNHVWLQNNLGKTNIQQAFQEIFSQDKN